MHVHCNLGGSYLLKNCDTQFSLSVIPDSQTRQCCENLLDMEVYDYNSTQTQQPQDTNIL